MDTLKDKQQLEQMVESGNGPWKVWELDADGESTGIAGRPRLA